jgi:acyl-CoA thioesterase
MADIAPAPLDVIPAGVGEPDLAVGVEVELSPTWRSMTGMLGGYLAAVMIRAAERCVDGRDARTATTAFLRPTLPGPATVVVETLRSGRSVSILQVGIRQGERQTATSRITFLVPTQGDSWDGARPPPLAPVERCVPIAPPPGANHFTNAEGRLDPADRPFSGGDRSRVAGYVRPLDGAPIDAAWLAMMLDWFPPSPFSRSTLPIGGTSVDYTVHVHRALPAVPAGQWLTGEFEAEVSSGGLALEHGYVRDPEGRPLAESFHTRWLPAV